MSELMSKEVRLKSRPTGVPQGSDFEVAAVAVEYPFPAVTVSLAPAQ
jgi:hypothetical protein